MMPNDGYSRGAIGFYLTLHRSVSRPSNIRLVVIVRFSSGDKKRIVRIHSSDRWHKAYCSTVLLWIDLSVDQHC